jgi:hypothetical protein
MFNKGVHEIRANMPPIASELAKADEGNASLPESHVWSAHIVEVVEACQRAGRTTGQAWQFGDK